MYLKKEWVSVPMFISDFSIKEIADRVGYTDYFYFSRVFKKVTGLSPSIFRKHMN